MNATILQTYEALPPDVQQAVDRIIKELGNGALLPARVRSYLNVAEFAPRVSMVSWWKIIIKQGLGKLTLPMSLPAICGGCGRFT